MIFFSFFFPLLSYFSSIFNFYYLDFKTKHKNPTKSRKKKGGGSNSYREDESKPLDKNQLRKLFSNLRPGGSANLGDISFAHRVSSKHMTLNDQSSSKGDFDPHSVFSSLKSSENDNTNVLGDTLSAYTESSPHTIPLVEDGNSEAGEDLPGAPQDVRASIVKTRFVTLSWQPPAFTNGDIITYSVYYRQEGSER